LFINQGVNMELDTWYFGEQIYLVSVVEIQFVNCDKQLS